MTTYQTLVQWEYANLFHEPGETGTYADLPPAELSGLQAVGAIQPIADSAPDAPPQPPTNRWQVKMPDPVAVDTPADTTPIAAEG